MIKKLYKRIVSERWRNKLITAFSKFTAPLYYGNNFYCNCCNKSFQKFLPKGNVRRQNAQCPYCGSLERSRALMLYFEQHPELFKGKKAVLHFAPENCFQPFFKNKKQLQYIDADINPELANHQIDITNIPYPDDYFDVIICSHVLGHVKNECKALEELYRVLKPNGKCIVLTLINRFAQQTFELEGISSASDRLKYYGENDLERLHGCDFQSRLERACFKVTVTDYSSSADTVVENKLSLGDGDRERIFLCQ